MWTWMVEARAWFRKTMGVSSRPPVMGEVSCSVSQRSIASLTAHTHTTEADRAREQEQVRQARHTRQGGIISLYTFYTERDREREGGRGDGVLLFLVSLLSVCGPHRS